MSEQIRETIRIDTIDNASATLKKIEDGLKRLKRQADKTFGNFKMPGIDRMVRGANQAAASAKVIDADTRALRNRIVGEMKVSRLRQKAAAAEDKARTSPERADASALKSKIVGMRKVARMRDRFMQDETRAKAAAEKAEMHAIRERVAFGARMARQRAGEERAAAREEAASARESVRLDRFRMRLRETYERSQARQAKRDRDSVIRHGREAMHSGSDAFVRSTRGAAAVGVAGAAGTGLALRRTLGVEADVDAAEIGTRQYGGLNKKQARELRDRWAAPMSEQLGVSTSKLLTSWTDAVKLGIPVAGAKQFAGLATQTSEAWGRPFEEVSDILGTINTIITSSGEAFSFDKLKGVVNTLQHLAAKQSTTPEKLISYLQRGAGGAQVLGMSQNAGLALGSASTSLGNQAGESGRLIDYMASRIVDLPKLVAGRGNQAQEARDLVKALGYTSTRDLDARRRANPDDFLPDFMDRFAKINDPAKQEKALRFFAGREWFGELGRMVKGNSTYQEAAKLAKESKNLDAIGEVWELHKQKLVFVGKQFSSGWKNILGEFGKELSPLARQAGDYFLDWSAKLRQGGLSQRFKAAITGFIEGLGFKDLPDLLKGMFGAPGEGNAGSIKAWGDAARGFGQGLRDVGNAITSFFRVFTGGNASPEVIGKWTGRIIAFSLACMFAAPVIGILGSIGGALAGFTLAAAGAWRVLKGLGLVGGAAAGAAGATAGGAAKAAGKGGWFGRLFGSRAGLGVAGAAAGGAMLGMSKEESDDMMLRLGEWARMRNGTALPPFSQEGSDKLVDQLREETEARQKLIDALKGTGKQGSNDTGFDGLRKLASFSDDGAREFKQSLAQLGARIETAAFGKSERPRLIGRRGVPETIDAPPPRTPSTFRTFGNVPGVLNGRPGGALDHNGMITRRGILGGGRIGGGSSAGNLTKAIEEAAAGAGIDPRIMHGIRAGESLRGSQYDVKSDRTEDSYGPFQLNRKGGLGAVFERETGLSLKDPKTIAAQAQWVAKHIRKRLDRNTAYNPGSEWYGYKGKMQSDPSWGDSGYVPNGAVDRQAGTSVAPRSGIGGVDELQGKVAAFRRQAIIPQLKDQLAFAATQAGVNAEVFSGGQDGHGHNRTGSHRHDHGRSADVRLYHFDANGRKRYLSMNDVYDREKMERFIRSSVHAGATGVGAGPGYMGEHGIHIGGGSSLAWGAGGRAANAPDWVRRAHTMGTADRSASPVDLAEWKKSQGTASSPPTAEALASSAAGSAARRPGDAMMGRGSGGNSIHAPITIQGGNSDPETLAQLVQKRLSETGRTRQHDLDFQSI